MKILLAEDERLTRRSLERQLVAWGHEVVAVEDGRAAWSQFADGAFQLIITDWEMPEVDGPELIRRIRAEGGSSYVYVIMLTARAGKKDLVEGMEAGADDFLTKPFDKNELRVRIRAGERIIELEQTLAEQNQLLQSANDHMVRDLQAAVKVQQSIMPKRAPEVTSVDCGWRYCPCDALAGDALNVTALDDRHLCLYVLDVSGHGVPASLLSVAVARSLWLSDDPTSIILSGADGHGGFGRFASPATVLTRLNHRFPFAANGNRFFTMIYSLLDVTSGRLAFCCGGHPGLIRVAANGATETVETPSHMVGVAPDPDYEDETLTLAPGDRVYFYSDGIIEQHAPSGAMFGLDRLTTTLVGARHAPLQEGIDLVVDTLGTWTEREGFDDDVSLLGFEWKG